MSANGINTNSKVVVLTGMSYLDVDRVIGAFTLASALANHHNEDVDVSLGFSLPQNFAQSLISASSKVNMVQDVSLASRALELNNILEDVGEVKWEKTSEGVKLQLFNLNGEAIDPTRASLEFSSGKYADAYLLGVRSEKYLLKLLTNTASADLKRVKLTSLNVVAKEEASFEANEYLYEELNSFSAAVFEYCTQNNIALSKSQHTDLLSGIYWKTNFMRNYFTTAKLMSAAAKLLSLGAEASESAKKIAVLDSKQSIDLWRNAKLVQESKELTILAVSNQADYEKLLNNQVSPVLSPSFYTNSSLTVTLMPIDDSNTYVVATTHAKDQNLNKLFRDFSPKGDNQQAKFKVAKNLEQAQKEIQELISPSQKSDLPVAQSNPVSASAPAAPSEPAASSGEPKSATPISTQPAKPEQPSASSAPEKADTPANTVPEKKDEPVADTAKAASIAEPAQSVDEDPLAPAKIDFRDILQDEEEEDAGGALGAGSLFGFGAGAPSADPLPKAKKIQD